MTNVIKTVDFHGHTISTIFHNDTHYVAMRTVAENIGLEWHSQRQRIKRNPVLNERAIIILARSETRGNQKSLCLPLDMLNGWLFGVQTQRVKSEVKEVLMMYQRECFKVLYNHFHDDSQKQKLESPYLSDEQLKHIKDSAGHIVHSSGLHWQTVYGRLNDYLGSPTVSRIRKEQYADACQFLGVKPKASFISNIRPLINPNKENRIAGIALMKYGAMCKSAQNREIEKLTKVVGELFEQIDRINHFSGAIHNGLSESYFQFSFHPDEIQEAKKKAEELFGKRVKHLTI